MNVQEEEVRKSGEYEIGQDLSGMSVEELDDMLVILQKEIGRLSEAKSEKSAHMSAAEALFKR